LAEHVVGVNGDPNITGRSYSKRDSRRVCCGVFDDLVTSTLGVKCRIVDPNSLRECENGEHGEIWLQSKSRAMGYWCNPEKTELTFNARLEGYDGIWLRTGDIGYMEKDEGLRKLFFVSRRKDILVIMGRNYAPKDLESPADNVLGIRPGCSAAFSVPSLQGTEQVVLVCEVRSEREIKALNITYPAIARALISAVSASESVKVSDIVLIKSRTIPKTSSGKLRRSECKKLYLQQKLEHMYAILFDQCILLRCDDLGLTFKDIGK